MIEVPMKAPAFNSNKVRPRRVRNEKNPTTMAAAANRRPTKNIGPLTVIACCTSKKVPPQIMVITTRMHSALLKRLKREEGFGAVMAARSCKGKARTAQCAARWAVYCAHLPIEQYSAQRKSTSGVGPATHEPDRAIGKVRRQPAHAGGHRGGREECQPVHPGPRRRSPGCGLQRLDPGAGCRRSQPHQRAGVGRRHSRQ